MENTKYRDVLLTIGIPTYNRSGTLKRLLAQIEAETPEGASVELLISDDASTDDSEQVVRQASSVSRMNYSYYRNATNLGFDGNITAIYQKAKGSYVWFLGDDDLIEPDGVRALLKVLQETGECGLIINNVRCGIQDGGLTDLVPYSPTGIKMHMRVGIRAAITNELERLAVVLSASQISTCVVRKYEQPFPDGPGGNHMQERLANLSLLRTPYFYVTEKPIVKGGPSWWTFWFMEAVMFGIRDLYAAPDMRFSKDTVDIVTTQTCKVGLQLLAQRYRRAIHVSYPEIDDALVNRLKSVYGDAYVMIEKAVDKARRAARHKKRDRIIFVMICPVYYGLKVIQLILIPRLRTWITVLRHRIRSGSLRRKA
jgi:glycosyltransferase involved in cell wall biosynthesis